jgi:hypothetical protein
MGDREDDLLQVLLLRMDHPLVLSCDSWLRIGIVVLFLLQIITDKVIESGTGTGTHMLHHLWI